MHRNHLQSGLREWCLGEARLDLAATQWEQLRSYIELLLLWNRKLALVSQSDPGEICAKHVADSLFIAGHCPDTGNVLDMGSGAGFPGLPIAIARPAAHVVLVESRGRKVSFLEEACRTASIRNARVYHTRVETLARDPAHRTAYAAVTARAFGSMKLILALARPLAAPNGRIILPRAASEPSELDPPEAEVVNYVLPDRTQRRLVIAPPPPP